MRAFGLFAALLLLVHCGPKLPEQDSGGSDSDATRATSGDEPPASTTTDTSGATATGPVTTGPDSSTTHDTTVGGECDGPAAAHQWTCRCTTVSGPWVPFNEACDKREDGAVEWAEWLCENYAGEEQTTGVETTGGTTADVVPDSTTTGDPTGSLGCACACEVTEICCDDSKP
ncbi:hypothetical protein SAMN02745121_05033 [Nannocystis exedens]|uniref:Uncharacterized protein n=1 Tax=Nannocystis exedens TaxID=54 RepID=A0A1I2CBQ3_9BACT|nr:hypothetical protein [Nannocystis exedens]PCC68400.1 hypothetical protein NAEX_01411 [Nannocystis exedens]SFE65632.1 hypothetical protein SAMN02745121_05033 [Nannocystis exedens]